MNKYLILTTASLFAAPAFAGGLGDVAPEPAVVAYEAPAPVDAGGDWSGAYVGAQLGYGDIDSNGAGLDGNGAIGGVHAGYLFDYGKFVAGAELNYDATNIDLGTANNATLDSVARLKLIAGFDMGSTLVYGAVGAAYAEATVGGATLKDNGSFAGLGVSYAVSDQWSVGGEYLYHKFDNFDASGVDFDVQTIQAKVSYSF
jgi:outer membrane immunogenic protein